VLSNVRLALFLNLPLCEVGGQYTARYPHLFDFFLALGARTARTALMLPLQRSQVGNPDYGTITLPPQVEVAGLPHWSSASMLVRQAHRVVPAALALAGREMGRYDLVGAVTPSLVGGILIGAARARRLPTFMLVRGEKQRTVRFMMGERRARPYVAALSMMEAPVRRWIRAGVPTFVAGYELVDRYAAPGARLYDLYPALSREFPVATRPRSEFVGPRPRLITVARLSPEKGVDDLLRALAILSRRGIDAELEILGDGTQRRELEELASQLRVGDRVLFTGFVRHGPDLVSRLDAADVFVLASRSEGLPHSLVEAMARGLPAVASAIGGIPQFLSRGGGVLVPVGDPGTLATTVAELLSDRSRWEKLSRQALETATRMHPEVQLDALAAHLADAYPELGGPDYSPQRQGFPSSGR
jgi:phosphatidylinositol alpha-1,6-mannosyltransferase